MKTIKVGDMIIYRAGRDKRESAKVENIDFCADEGVLYGTCVDEVQVEDVPRCVFDLDNGKWIFGYKIIMK